MANKSGTPLVGIAGFPADAAQRLGELWITTAEELVSTVVHNGPDGLAQTTGLTVERVTELTNLAQAALPPGVSFDVNDARSFGLGARDEPTDADQRAGPAAFAPLPTKVDLHDRMPPIRDQGQRGTCVSFASTAVREYLLAQNGEICDLSEQFLYWDCKQHDMVPGSGTFIQVAMDRLLNDGECPEQVWPYNPVPIPQNEGQAPLPADAPTQAGPYRISSTKKLPARSPDDLRQTLADGFPIAFAVPVYTYWFSEPILSGGDIRMPIANDQLAGGHAMCMVGYEDDPQVPGGGYFMIRNSWGTGWASKGAISPGYARLPYAYMQQYASAAHTAAASPAPVPDPKSDPQEESFFVKLLRYLRNIVSGG